MQEHPKLPELDAPTASTSKTPTRGDRSTLSPLSPLSPFSPHCASCDVDEHRSLSSSARSSSHPITIPYHWREETESCIAARVLDSEARSDIVHTLVTLLVVRYGPKPGTSRCQQAACQLILKYPFMADDLGCGYVSLLCFAKTFISLCQKYLAIFMGRLVSGITSVHLKQ